MRVQLERKTEITLISDILTKKFPEIQDHPLIRIQKCLTLQNFSNRDLFSVLGSLNSAFVKLSTPFEVRLGLYLPQIFELIVLLILDSRLPLKWKTEIFNFRKDNQGFIDELEIQYLSAKIQDPLYGLIGLTYPYLRILKDSNFEFSKKMLLEANMKANLFTQEILSKRKKVLGNHIWTSEFNVTSAREVNLGGAHGIPSILRFLYFVKSCSILPNATNNAIRSATDFFNKVLRMHGSNSLPSYFPMESPARDIQQWCYGPLSAKYQFHAAILDENSMAVSKLFKRTLKFDDKFVKLTNLKNPIMCHGTMGCAYMYWSMAHHWNQSEFSEQFLIYYDQTLKILSQRKTDSKFFSNITCPTHVLNNVVGMLAIANSIELGMSDYWSFILGNRYET